MMNYGKRGAIHLYLLLFNGLGRCDLFSSTGLALELFYGTSNCKNLCRFLFLKIRN